MSGNNEYDSTSNIKRVPFFKDIYKFVFILA
jgi:hypothetical protein